MEITKTSKPPHTPFSTGVHPRHNRNLSGMSNVSYDSIEQSPQKRPRLGADQPDNSSCFMGLLDCLLAPFHHIIDFILWVVCCGRPNPVDRFIGNPEKTSKELVKNPVDFATDFVNAINSKLPQIAASWKSALDAEKAVKEAESRLNENVTLGLSKLIFAGTEFEDMFPDAESMTKLDLKTKYGQRAEKFEQFQQEVSDIRKQIHPQYIFWQLYESTGQLIKENTAAKTIVASLHIPEDEPLKLMGALKENQAFRKLVLVQVLQNYMDQHLNFSEHKFPVLAALIEKIKLTDESQADGWVKQFLEMIMTVHPENPIYSGFSDHNPLDFIPESEEE